MIKEVVGICEEDHRGKVPFFKMISVLSSPEDMLIDFKERGKGGEKEGDKC